MCNMNTGVIYNLQGAPENYYWTVSSSLFSCSSSLRLDTLWLGSAHFHGDSSFDAVP